MPVTSGGMLSHYRLIEKIGEGGMGVVWKAEDTVLGRIVAIKVLPTGADRDERRRKMFFDEARLASSLSEAHIVQVYEFGREGNLDFIVMEYVEGKPLNKILHGRPMPPEKVAEIGYQVAHAISKAHRKGLLHRDLKPANILITPDGDAKVVDFGLATLFTPQESTIGTAGPTQSLVEGTDDQQKGVVGTIPYMSPEQVRGEKLGARSDIFSLGVVLYEMTTGRRPFQASSRGALAEEIHKARPLPVHEIVPRVPLDLDRIIQKAMSPRPADRYQTMDDLGVDLKRLSRDLDSGSSPSYQDVTRKPLPGKASRGVRIGSVAFILALLLGIAYWWIFLPGGKSSDPFTLLVLPMRVQGQEEGAEFVGRVLAEAIAVNLAQAPELKILPVPTVPVLENGEIFASSRLSREAGAGRYLTGTVVREGDLIHASLSLVDAGKNRIVWGTQMTAREAALVTVAPALARRVVSELIGGRSGPFYDSVLNTTGNSRMAALPETSRALGALRRNQADIALIATGKILAAFPDEPDAHLLDAAARIRKWRNDPSPANLSNLEERLETLERLDPRNPYPQIYRAWSSGELRETIELLTSILSREDLTPAARVDVLRIRAWRKRNIGDLGAAIDDLEEALRLDPADAGTLSSIGVFLREADRFRESVTRARQAVALEPSNWIYQLYLGRALEGGARWEEASEAIATACDPHPAQRSCAYLAIVLFKAGRNAEARAAAENAAPLTDSPDGAYNLACFWSLAGEPERAIAFLERSQDLGLRMAWLARDPDLSSLHGRPKFEAIVEEMKRRTRPGSATADR